MSSKNSKVGIIAEDDSDIVSLKVLISRISGNSRLSTAHQVGRGCGTIKKKCRGWANVLAEKGCTSLVLVQDLDNNRLATLKRELQSALGLSPIKNSLIVIPVREIEAWLISDPAGIKTALNLKKLPRVTDDTESVMNPKEYLEEVVDKASEYKKIYQNTQHNCLIAQEISIDLIYKKCPSFVPFHDFVQKFI